MCSSIRRIALLASTLLCSATMVVAASASAAPRSQEVDWATVEQALGRSGQMPGDVFRIGMPRTDLKVTVEDVPVQAGFALVSYAAFKQYDDGTMVMGDLVLLDQEVNGVLSGLFDHGFRVTALHNHLNNMSPHVLYMHYEGHGDDPVELAAGLHQALSASATPLSPASPPPSPAAPSGPQLDTATLDSVLGYTGRLNGNIEQFSIGRTETIVEMGHELVPAQGVTTAINFQPTGPSTAAITGDFVMLESEVNAVASTLRANGIQVTAVHQHHLAEEPRLLYMHFWANEDAASLARGLRAALDQTASVPPQVSSMR